MAYIFAMLAKILYNLTNLDIKKYSINDFKFTIKTEFYHCVGEK